MAEIVRYTGDVIRSDDAAAIDPGRLGDCPRCGRPVIAGKRGYGCSGWRDGCPFVLWREYRDQPLTEDQVRELLQRRVLGPLTIDGSGPGRPPSHGQRRPDGDPGPDRRSAGTGQTEEGQIADDRTAERLGDPSSQEVRWPTAEKRAPEPDSSDSRTRRVATTRHRRRPHRSPRERTERFAPVALGRCPLCGSDVVEQPKSYGCSGWKQGCKFAIWKTIAGKAIGVRTAQALLKRGQSPLLKGFRSKAGKPFEARLKLEGGEVRFEFGTGDRRPPKSSDPD